MRNIVLTGVTRGCGRALLDTFAKLGHTVFGCGRNASQIEELSRNYPAPHDLSVLDVSDENAVVAWASSILSEGITPDLVVNNAGVINASAPLWEVPSEEFERVIDVNVKGSAWVMRAFLPAMISRGSGVVVNMSSGWGRSASGDVAPYCASKWAIEGLSRSVAQEVPRGIAVVALNPGIIHTEMLDSCFGDSASSYPTASEWAGPAAERILGIGVNDNGSSLSV